MTQQLSFDDLSIEDGGPSTDDETTRVALTYARSDDGDNIQQQLQQGIEYTQNELDYDVAATVNKPRDTEQSGSAIRNNVTGDTITILYDTNDTHPREIEHLIDITREYAVEDVIVDNLATLSTAIEDISKIIGLVNDEGATIHALDDNFAIPPGSDGDDARAALRAVARTIDVDAQPRVTGETHSGRPPAGFEIVDGRLRKADDYQELRHALIDVIKHGLPHADAVRRTNYSRATIIQCKNRNDLYNLPSSDDDEVDTVVENDS